MQRAIVVVGSVNLDLVSRGRRIPVPGETIQGDTFGTFHGGKGANQAVAVARLGHAVRMVAKVGDDDFGVQLRKGLHTAGVDVRAVCKAENISSGVALISVDAKGQNSITVVPGANGRLLPEDLERAAPLLRSAGMILTQLEIPMESVEYLCELAQRFAVPLMLDPAPARAVPRSMLRSVTYLTPNETETCALCKLDPSELTPATAPEAAKTLRSRGAANVVLKMGRHGAYVSAADGSCHRIPAFKVRSVDTTAAGDAFNGGLAVALMRGLPLREAARYAAAVGGLSTARAGAQDSMPTETEVTEMLHSVDHQRTTPVAPERG